MKRILTRALVARGMERHTIVPGRFATRVIDRLNTAVRQIGLEVVKIRRSSPQDYIESGHEASNRVEDAETMLGTRQLDLMQRCIVDVIEQNVPGDLLEAGVWRGGMTIFMRAVLAAYDVTDRKVWVVDSFSGLPEINREKETFPWRAGDMAASLTTVKNNFARYNLLDDQVIFVEGLFRDTLPRTAIGQLAILRIDADLYQSTMDVLAHLYSHLSAGGYAICDDYQNLPDCRRAIDEFRSNHGITEEIRPIDQRAVFWRKLA